MRLRLVALAAATLFAIAACNKATESVTPTAQPSSATCVVTDPNTLPEPGQGNTCDGLTIKVTGTCQQFSGLRLESSGFTPNGQYQIIAWYPDGAPYTYLLNGGKGRADNTGATPNWTWDCRNGAGGKLDPEGIYVLRMIDLTTSKTVMARFTVKF